MMAYDAEERVKLLKERRMHCVCKYCGGELRLKRMVFHQEDGLRIEIFCQQCNRIEFGVEKETYLCAKSFVEDLDFDCYPDLERNESTKRMTIAKVCEIISWADKKRGFLSAAGFKVPVNTLENLAGEIVFIDSQEAERLLKEGGSDG